MIRAPLSSSCIFCQIARSSTSTTLLYSDDRVVAFQDINPSAFRLNNGASQYPRISTCVSWELEKQQINEPYPMICVKNLQRGEEDFALVSHMLDVGKTLLHSDAPGSKKHRFGFHQPPFNSVDHLHLHCLALPFIPSWKSIKYAALGPLGGFIEAEKLLERLKPLSSLASSL